MALAEAREMMSETVDLVAFEGERVILQRHGRDEVALISIADLELLEVLEDRADIAAARTALAESPERRKYRDVRKELGLAK